MLISGCIADTGLRAGSPIWRGAIALMFLSAAVPAEAQDGNWGGFYGGLHAGGAWGNTDTNVGCVDNVFGGALCAAAVAERAFPFNMSTDLDGFIGGAQAGYNFQGRRMVVGFEADIAWTSSDSSASVATGATTNFQGNVVSVSQDLEYLATVRGRLGYAVHSNMLLYATGGFAFGDVDYSYALEFSPSGDYAKASDSKTQTGWTIGGGGEYSFGHWSLKAEYLYYDLGEETLSAQAVEETPAITPSGGPVNIFFNPEYETQGHIARLGLNFRFGSHYKRQSIEPLK